VILFTGFSVQSKVAGYRMNINVSNVDESEIHDYYVSDYGVEGDGLTNDMEAIRNAVNAFANDPNPARLHFENKTYRCTGSGKLFELDGVKNKTVLGNGAELIVQPSILGLQISQSENVIVKDLKFDSDPLSWTQGTITAIDAANKKFRLEIDEGYPIPTNNYGNQGRAHPWGMIWEPEGYNIKNELVWIASSTNLSGNLVELRLQDNSHNALNDMNVNDRFTVDVYGVGGSFNKISESKNISCENLTFYATRSLAFAILDNVGLIHMNGIEMRRKPGTNRLLSCYRDGFHCKRNTQGPIIENCYIEGLCDDAINLSGGYYYVTGISSANEFQLDNTQDFDIGDTLLFVDVKNGIELRKTQVASKPGANLITTTNVISGVVAGEPQAPATTYVMNLNKSNSGFIIRNNTFGGQRRFAMLIRSQNGLVENNTGTKTGGGIMLMNEINSFFEGPIPRNITIRNNTFTEIRGWPIMANFASWTRDSERLISDIKLTDNTFGPSTVDKPAAFFSDTKNMELSGNEFVNDISKGALEFENCRRVFLCNNTYNGTDMSYLSNDIILGANISASDITFNCDDIGTSINHLNRDNNFQVYPNPVKDKLYICTDIESYQLEIIDVQGKKNQIKKNAPDNIDLSGLCPGVYWVSIISADKKYTEKIIKY
jgi:hypothetical protein